MFNFYWWITKLIFKDSMPFPPKKRLFLQFHPMKESVDLCTEYRSLFLKKTAILKVKAVDNRTHSFYFRKPDSQGQVKKREEWIKNWVSRKFNKPKFPRVSQPTRVSFQNTQAQVECNKKTYINLLFFNWI